LTAAATAISPEMNRNRDIIKTSHTLIRLFEAILAAHSAQLALLSSLNAVAQEFLAKRPRLLCFRRLRRWQGLGFAKCVSAWYQDASQTICYFLAALSVLTPAVLARLLRGLA